MSSQPENHSNVAKEGGTALSKRVAKKETLKQENLKRQQEAAAADPLSENYGDVLVRDLQSKAVSGRKWTDIGLIDENKKGETVLIRGRIQTIRPVGNQLVFLVLRRKSCTMQCVVKYAENVVSRQMVKFASSLTKESHVDVEGIVSVPNAPIKKTTQQVELQVRKIKRITVASPIFPIHIEDIRTVDLRTAANQAIFRLQCEVENVFRKYLLSEGFVGIHTPRLLAGSSKGCAAVFRLDYDGRPACLAQSTQLHRQMTISADYDRVFEIGPVFRAQFGSVCEGAEDSFAHRHLCEFIDLGVEMEIYEHYSEVMDVVDCLFVAMFDSLNENCKKELEAIGKQYPSEPLKYLRKTLRLNFEDGVQMLKEAGVVVKPLGDLNTEEQRMLGKLVLEKYGTEFYILHRYPLAVNYYTMPCYDDPEYSNSFDVFIRGEGIASAGGQRIHVPELLSTKAKGLGIDEKSFQTYIDAFRYGTPPHGGFEVGLERVVMLFCGLNDIRKTSLFPRGPKMIIP